MGRRRGRAGGIARRSLATLVVVASSVAMGVTVSPAAAAMAPVAALVQEPASLVNPMDGTGTGPVNPGTIGEFPGADVPFGMLQWSPDTLPDTVMAGGGYANTDTSINGFSLTHLSGTGCPSYQDVPILPTVGAITSPEATSDTFSPGLEKASPGRYAVVLGPTPIGTALAVTTHTGISTFTFPATNAANVLFKVAGSINPVSAAQVSITGNNELSGQVSSGQFCQTGTDYTLYFVAQFERPFVASGTWRGSAISAGTRNCSGPDCGAYVTFKTQSQRTVVMKVGISFVSVRNAQQNLRGENPGWSLAAVARQAAQRWNALLGRISIGGGTPSQQRTFYTALYHSLLFPNVVSDANGQYVGEDGKVHHAPGSGHYANFSEWDIYRSEIELESLLAPDRVGDMMQSLVDDAQQGGWLPKWAIVDGDESQINGDSADPIIAAAYAFGVRNFDVSAALRAMVKGATQNETGHGLEIERQYLSQYLSQHYINASSLDLTSIDYSIGGSATLEYAIDDFAIAQLAQAVGNRTLSTTMSRRAHNWEYLFNPATGYIQGRNADGSFDPGPAFQASLLEPGGETGFEEGNAIQYTWSVPQDLVALASLMGGDAQAVGKLNTFFSQLNATRDLPYDWAGNEPSLWTPWEYDYFGAPSRTQAVVRQIVNTLYADVPADEPGNDDLGAISSWYVWAALGLYPVTPGTANLALGSPLFPEVRWSLPDGHSLVIHAPAAAANRPYISSLSVHGVAQPAVAPSCGTSSGATKQGATWNVPWLPASVLRTGATLDFTLSSRPNTRWATSSGASPPSFGAGLLPAVGFSFPSGATTITTSTPAPIEIGVVPARAGSTLVNWSVVSTPGTTVSPASGSLQVPAATVAGCASHRVPTETLAVSGQVPGPSSLTVHLVTSTGVSLPPVVVDLTVLKG